MKWLNKLERKIGKFSISNLMSYIVATMLVIYVLEQVMGIPITGYLILIPGLVMKGQIWRLITYIFIPPNSSVVFIFFALYFYYLIGTSLESEWGSFKFNVYYLIGMAGTTIAAMLTGYGTSVYLNLSLFLAFAFLYPDFEVLIFFILPVKMKYLAYLDWAFFAFTILFSTMVAKAAAIASLINFFIFFGGDFIDFIKRKKRYGSTQKNFKKELRNFKRIK